jgi:beta-mannanase
MSAVAKFEQMTGKPLSLLEFSSPFADCSNSPCSFYPFPWTPFNNIRAHGAIPFFSWGSESIPNSLNQPDFQLADVIAGTYDSYIREFAIQAREWNHPFFLRFNWEMNGNWFSWSEGTNGNQPGEYVAAWRHVHDIFASVGANDASWVWCPYVDPNSTLQSLTSLYPGDAYVDWTCLDGYNWGPNATPPRTWRSFNYLFNSTYHQIVDTIAPSKPMVVGETASSEYGGSKAGWIHNMFEALSTEFPKIRGVIWFEKQDGMDWPLESSESALSSFAAGIANPRYVANSYGGISATPIPAP